MKKLKKIWISLLLWVLFIVIFYNIFPYFIKVEIKNIPYSNIIYDSNDIEIWEIIAEWKYRHIHKNIEEYPDFLKKALVEIEDRRFYQNDWIDYISLIRAIKNNFSWWNLEWASTISSQVIRNNYWLNEKRTLSLKIKEFLLSLALNKKYSKYEILEFYLNNINFWYLNYSFESASRFYFWKEIQNLTKAETISLITIIKNPNKYNPIDNYWNFRQRFKILVKYLGKSNIIDENEINSILNEKLIFSKWTENKLQYVIDFLKKRKLNWNKIKTTIDYNLTQKIKDIWDSTIRNLYWKNVWDYWVLIVDRKTNDLKVMIWWYDYDWENWQVNSTLALRQPWSTLKPFLYLQAFKELWYKKETTITDLPIQFPTKDWNLYSPKNYSLDYKWEITLAESLSQSINIPAVKLLNKIWIDNFLKFLKNVWITSLNEDADFYWLSIALGSWEVSLYELIRAYTIFSNKWFFCEINFIYNGKSNCKEIIDEKYTNEVYDILTNKYFKIESFPINSNLDFWDKEVFAKTWTSRNFKDNWVIWFTKDYIIWVWAWNKDWTEMKWVSWVSWAWDIFKKIVESLENNTNKSINKIDLKKEDFLEITSPLNWSIYEIDSTIPKDYQKVKINFETNIEYNNKKVFINWVEFKNDFINIFLYKWENELKIEIFKDDKLINSKKTYFKIKN